MILLWKDGFWSLGFVKHGEIDRGNGTTTKQSLKKQFQDFVVIKENCTEEWSGKYNAMKRINWGQFKVQNLARGQLSKLVHVHYTNKLQCLAAVVAQKKRETFFIW